MAQSSGGSASTDPDILAETDTSVLQQALEKELRSWSVSLAFWGVMSFAFAGLNSAWGILLFLVAGLAFVFKDAAMFVVFAVTLAWAGITNATTLQAAGIIFGLIQLVLAAQVFRKSRSYQTIPPETLTNNQQGTVAAGPRVSRTARAFPPLGCGLSLLAALSALMAFIALIVLAVMETQIENFATVGLVAGLVVDVAVLALAISLAALISRFRWRGLSITTLVVSGLILIGWIVLIVTAPPA